MKYGESNCFHPIPEDAADYESGKGDFVVQRKDGKGIYWVLKAVFADQEMNEADLKHAI